MKYGPLPEQEPSWFSRRSWVPFALRRDRIVVEGAGDRLAVVGRIDRVDERFRFYQWVRLEGFRLTVHPRVGPREYDFHFPVFVGKVVSVGDGVRIKGVIRPTHLAWIPLVMIGVVLFGASSDGTPGPWPWVVVGALVLAFYWGGLVFGRGRDRRRRAQIVMVLELLADAPAARQG